MIAASKDNILDLVKHLEEQKLDFVLAVWSPQKAEDKNKDIVSFYTSFNKEQVNRLKGVLNNLKQE